jgi:hypothetical protein
MNRFLLSIGAALRRARAPILWIGLAYAAGVVAGAGMVHLHSGFALAYRDKVVGRAMASDPAALTSVHGFPVRAAFWDFAGNLGRGAVPSTVMGLAVALPFPLAVFRGWVGGIVSVDGEHRSRLGKWREGSYYLGVLLLQLLPYTLAGGAGVRLGLGFLMPRGRWGYPSQQRWLTLPAEGVRDVARIYALIVPLFLVASLVEFLIR